ncbi:MAG: hypothetical protein Q9M16_04250 [Mariprofundus sp.]|nr:hypothetical protein [Mariprofundus sp.]
MTVASAAPDSKPNRAIAVATASSAPVVELLELLKGDENVYVRRSVANHLNDIAISDFKICEY